MFHRLLGFFRGNGAKWGVTSPAASVPLPTSKPTQRPSSRPVRPEYGADLIGLVGFHDTAMLLSCPCPAFSPELQQQVQSLNRRLGGMTNLTDGLAMALDVLGQASPGAYRRIWALSDGYPNVHRERLDEVAATARRRGVNINTIGFGDNFDRNLLESLSRQTHNGRFVPVSTLRELTRALGASRAPNRRRYPRPHRREITVFVIDLSASMAEPMEGRTKIAVVQEALLHLLHYKQQYFS